MDEMLCLSAGDLDVFSQEFCNVPHLSERMIVDLVNGHDVADDLLMAKKNQGKLGRFIGMLDGSNRRREIIIQEQTQRSLEVLTSWTLDLTDSVRFTQENVILVTKKLKETRDDLLCVAKAVCSNHQKIQCIENNLSALDFKLSNQLSLAEERLLRVEDKQEVIELTEAWMSGRFYDGYPLPIQIGFVVDDLMRGERGRRIENDPTVKGFLLDRIVNISRSKQPDFTGDTMSLTDDWLPASVVNNVTKRELAAYGLAADSSSYYHNAFSEHVDTGKLPEWYYVSQDDGHLREFVDIADVADLLIQEAKSV